MNLKKCIQIGDNDLIGHRFNGYDLSFYLQRRGIDCEYFVWSKKSKSDLVTKISSQWDNRDKVHCEVVTLNNDFSSQAMFYPFSYNMLFERKFQDADILHLHLIHNSFFNLSDLLVISKLKPVVWTLHDPWVFTGHCVYPMDCKRWMTGCGDCPDLERTFTIKHDTSALNWENKKLILEQLDLDLVVASKWMEKLVPQSPFFKNSRVHHVPFGLNLSLFKPNDTLTAKKRLNIPAQNKVICFRAVESVFKGLDYIREVLRRLDTSQKITLLTFNEKGLMDEFKDKFQCIDMGWVSDDEIMINAYNASDVFLMPSTAEAFGMMAMEAMACGKPVIVMDGTALEEVVMADKGGGVVVPQGDVTAMQLELQDILENGARRIKIGETALALARDYYDKERYVSQLMDIYNHSIERRKNDKRSEYIIQQLRKLPPVENTDYDHKFNRIISRWTQIAERHKRLILYGAGKFSLRLLLELRKRSLRMPDVIWDDLPQVNTLIDVPVEKTPVSFPENINPVVLGTDTYQKKMVVRLKQISGTLPLIIDLIDSGSTKTDNLPNI